MTPVRAPRSRVKHSTTEPLRSLFIVFVLSDLVIVCFKYSSHITGDPQIAILRSNNRGADQMLTGAAC